MDTEQALKPTYLIDCDSESIVKTSGELTEGQEDRVERAKRLFYFVRDRIKYNAYVPKDRREFFRASATLARGEGYCVQKAVLLVALSRAAGIPARLGFAMIKNNSMPPKLFEIMKTNIFLWHGYTNLYLNGKWIKATPTFDKEMCEEGGIIPVEFDGHRHARFHPQKQNGELHIEYMQDYGPFDDVPLDDIWSALEERRMLK